MRRQDLEKQILDYIKTLYKAEYIGLLLVTQVDSIYTFKIGIPSYMVPTSIICDSNSDDEFLKNVYEELRTRNYMRLDKYKTVRTSDTREE